MQLSITSLPLFCPLFLAFSCCSTTNSLHFAFAFASLLCAVLKEPLPAFRLRRVKQFTVDGWIHQFGCIIAFARLLLPLLLSRFTCCQLICINYFLTSKHERGCGQRGGGGRWVAYIRCPCRENKKTVGQTRNKNREWQWQLIDKQLNWTVNSNNNNNKNISTGEMKTTTAVIESILNMLSKPLYSTVKYPVYCYIPVYTVI